MSAPEITHAGDACSRAGGVLALAICLAVVAALAVAGRWR